MPMIPNKERPPEESRARAPIDAKWKEEFVENLLRELRRQLQQLQNTAPTAETDQAGIRAQNVVTLARIERAFDHANTTHEAQAQKRDPTMAANNDNAREALERRLDQLLIAARAQVPVGKSDE